MSNAKLREPDPLAREWAEHFDRLCYQAFYLALSGAPSAPDRAGGSIAPSPGGTPSGGTGEAPHASIYPDGI